MVSYPRAYSPETLAAKVAAGFARAQQWIDEQTKGRFAQPQAAPAALPPIQDLKPQPQGNGVDPAMLAAALANLTPEQRAQLNL